MEDPKKWVELLFTYGPFALFVFFVVVCEVKARTAMNESPKGKTWIYNSIYIGVWAAIFSLGAVTTYVWIKHTSRDELEIKGTLGNFVQEQDGDVTLHSRSNNLFIRKVYVGDGGSYSYLWRVILENRLQQRVDLDFTFQRACPASRLDAKSSTDCERSVNDFRLSLEQDAFNRQIRILQDGSRKAFKYYIDGKEIGTLRAEQGTGSPKRASADSIPASLFPVALAQKPASLPDAIAKRFYSSDPLIRRDAAREFAALGAAGIDWIKRGLFEGKSRNQSRLDALVVLNELPDVERGGFDDTVVDRLFVLGAEGDSLVSGQAYRAIARIKGGQLLAATHVESRQVVKLGGEIKQKYSIWVDRIEVGRPFRLILFRNDARSELLDSNAKITFGFLSRSAHPNNFVFDKTVQHRFSSPVDLDGRKVMLAGLAGAPRIGNRFINIVLIDTTKGPYRP